MLIVVLSDQVGNGAVYPLSAWIANKYGRKTGIYIGYALIVIGVCLSLGPNGSYFVASRAVIGTASCFFSGIVAMLITETAYPTHRSIATALYNTGWYVGGAYYNKLAVSNSRACPYRRGG